MNGMSVLDPPVDRHLGFNESLHPDRSWIRLLRLGVGILVLVALAQKTYDATLPGSDVDIFQLYSEFTVQSNLVLGLVFWLVDRGIPGNKPRPGWLIVYAIVLFAASIFAIYWTIRVGHSGAEAVWSDVVPSTDR